MPEIHLGIAGWAIQAENRELFQDTGDIQYVRLHGHPRMYYSPYRANTLRHLATWLKASDRPAWVIFDNTAEYHAVPDALRLRAELTGSPGFRAPSPPGPGAGRAPRPGAA